ncbi:N-acetylmuramoyl-L-alanine amidase [Phreatobacter stygius]|uniref:N-acetylmuramoyl-L-alanine amidase n=1 Tax=Phreatobacter stygius TaxID=1940610 RepID=A0A4D7B1T0_9HYPH|nr:N-acetylmuramoyl-L-alanine amidase [Phreatobacter stygius]QCI67679.1 N-acetylmuramoyl-L-alanine amidase [Phreatobacter stygius]
MAGSRFLGALLAATLFAGEALRAETSEPVSTGAIASTAARDGGAGEARAHAARTILPAVVSGAHITGDGGRTRLSFELTRNIEIRAFALADPYRVIIDLDEVNFQIGNQRAHSGARSTAQTAGTGARGLIQAFRYGLFAPSKSRVVVDLTGPALIERAHLVEGRDGAPPQVVLELVRTDADGFRRAQNERATSNLARRGDREGFGPRVSTRTAAPDGPPVVIIDPGHGGIDPGAVAASGEEEKTIILDFARVLRDKLNATGRYRVVMTRDRDIFIPLGDRVRIAREHNGALFVSIHADSISGAQDNARGVTVYTLSDRASDADSARLAERENKADAIAGLDLSDEPSEIADILIDLTRRETRMFSANFARTLAGEMRHATRMHRLPLRSAGFQVLRAHDIPSVLVELGFVSSAKDVEMLTSAIWRQRTADSVTKAIDQFFAGRAVARPAAQR